MKRILSLIAVLALSAGACQKQDSEAERKAEIERQVQARLAAERQAGERKKMAQRQAQLEAQVQALAARQKRAVATATPATAESSSTPVTASASEDESASYSTFYRKLEPYGDWMETGDYGYVFQPLQASQSRDWRPYTDGHWVYTDAGWTWISDEKFGWATYHYGRWIRLRGVGWVWVPGEQWAPAWVSWRRGGDYVGWAPLPPEAHFDRGTGIRNWADNYYDIGPEQYAFVPANEFGRKFTPREIVPTERNVTIINQTSNVTNIVYNNSVIVDRGPSYDDLGSRSRQPIERYRLERRHDLNNEGPVIRGEVVALPAADFHPTEHAARPTRVVRQIAQPVVERGWTGIQNGEVAQKTRAKMQAEATPPANLPPKRFVRPEQRTAVPPRPAPVEVGQAASPPPASASPPQAATTELAQPSPAENIFSPKKADRAAQEKKRRERRAERQQKMDGRPGGKSDREEMSPAPSASPAPAEPAATTSPAASEAAITSPAPTGSNREATAERRRAKRAERRAKRGQASSDASASPSPQQP